MTAMDDRPPDDCLREVRRLVDRYRSSCLWFMAPDYYPATRAEVPLVLAQVEQHGDREAFVAAASIRQWLSPTSSDRSAAS